MDDARVILTKMKTIVILTNACHGFFSFAGFMCQGGRYLLSGVLNLYRSIFAMSHTFPLCNATRRRLHESGTSGKMLHLLFILIYSLILSFPAQSRMELEENQSTASVSRMRTLASRMKARAFFLWPTQVRRFLFVRIQSCISIVCHL